MTIFISVKKLVKNWPFLEQNTLVHKKYFLIIIIIIILIKIIAYIVQNVSALIQQRLLCCCLSQFWSPPCLQNPSSVPTSPAPLSFITSPFPPLHPLADTSKLSTMGGHLICFPVSYVYFFIGGGQTGWGAMAGFSPLDPPLHPSIIQKQYARFT